MAAKCDIAPRAEVHHADSLGQLHQRRRPRSASIAPDTSSVTVGGSGLLPRRRPAFMDRVYEKSFTCPTMTMRDGKQSCRPTVTNGQRLIADAPWAARGLTGRPV